MMTSPITRYTTIMALLVVFTLSGYFLCFADPDSSDAGASAIASTPAPGTPLRKAILDALRQEVWRLHGIKVVFVVRHLAVKKAWAWVHTQPQSPDGAERYEDFLALMNMQNGVWRVAEIPCSAPDNPNCLDGPEYFEGLKRRFPKMPIEIFPGVQ